MYSIPRAAILLLLLWALPASAAPPVKVRLTTTLGEFVVTVDAQHAPLSAENFLRYVRDGFYDGLLFHRVIPGFMIQGGGLTPQLTKKPTRPPIRNEADNGLRNVKGSIAMARTSDPHSATAQFFVNVTDNAFLNHRGRTPNGWGYAVFGRISDGMDVVDRIAHTPTTTRNGYRDVPRTPVIITHATVIAPPEPPASD